jgi:hypothetical protein
MWGGYGSHCQEGWFVVLVVELEADLVVDRLPGFGAAKGRRRQALAGSEDTRMLLAFSEMGRKEADKSLKQIINPVGP